MNNRPQPGQGMPGYTGYVSAQISESREQAAVAEMQERAAAENAKTKRNVPGYCGFVPQLKSENVFGNTYGSTTQQQREGKIHGGFDVQGAERFKSVTQGVYT